ncbi:MAG TPA: hypothetical protein VLE73_06625 [Candidatus Saccharimonadales bacterium]|nr:hypothetical protein [Candidatus Saccharimonadales bacterium]
MAEFDTPPACMPDIIVPPPFVPEVAPAEQFAAHVQQVREHGDALDRMRIYNLRYSLGVIGVGVGGVFASTFSLDHPGVTMGVATAVSAIEGYGVYITASKMTKADRRKALTRFGEDSQAANNASYELYRTDKKSGAVAMEWRGIMTSNTAEDEKIGGDEQLERIAQLAKEYGVSKILINDELARHCVGDTLLADTTTMEEWLRTHKKLHTIGATKTDVMHEATPAEWLQRAETHQKTGRATTVEYMYHAGDVHESVGGVPVIYEAAGMTDSKVGRFSVYLKATELTETALKVGVTVTVPEPLQPVDDPKGTQYELVGNSSLASRRPNLGRKQGILAAAWLATTAVLAPTQGIADQRLSTVERQASAEIARQHGVDPASADVDPKAAEKLAASWHGVNGAWGAWRDARNGMYDWITSLPSTIGDWTTAADPTARTGLSGGVGNVDPSGGEGLAAWTLTPHNMSQDDLQGNWSIATASVLEADDYLGHKRVEWLIDELGVSQSYKNHPDTVLPTFGSYVKAEAPFNVHDIVSPNTEGGLAYIPVPVRDGMSIIAARVDGESTGIMLLQNGLYGLQPPEGDTGKNGKVEYWLIKGNAYKTSAQTGLHAVGDLVIDTAENSGIRPYDPAVIRNVIKKHYPYLNDASLDAYAKRLHTSMSYRLSPLGKKTISHMDSWDGLLDEVLDGKKANCNVAVASFALGAAAMQPDKKINMVESFSNASNPLVLSNGEAHARAVDDAGTVYEPTPGAALGLDGLQLKSITSDEHNGAPLWPYALGGVGAAAVGVYVGRRQAAKAGARGARLARDGYLAATAKKYRADVAKLEHAAWGRPGSQPDPVYVRHRKKDATVTGAEAYQQRQALRSDLGISARRKLGRR